MSRSRRMGYWRGTAALAALLVVANGYAQSPDLRTRMGEAEFRAAGLDKLSAEELARLDAWLVREIADQGAQAASMQAEQRITEVREAAREEGRREVVERHRGFIHFGSDEPIISAIVGEFTGFAKGRRYRLDNGQVWEQTDNATLAGVRREHPGVHIRPGTFGVWWMRIDGYNTAAKVRRVE